jgi:hypothetical protein
VRIKDNHHHQYIKTFSSFFLYFGITKIFMFLTFLPKHKLCCLKFYNVSEIILHLIGANKMAINHFLNFQNNIKTHNKLFLRISLLLCLFNFTCRLTSRNQTDTHYFDISIFHADSVVYYIAVT